MKYLILLCIIFNCSPAPAKNILILGDSILASLEQKHFDKSHKILNLARKNANVSDVYGQLIGASNYKYDVIAISIGVNDLENIEKKQELINSLSKKAKVLYLPIVMLSNYPNFHRFERGILLSDPKSNCTILYLYHEHFTQVQTTDGLHLNEYGKRLVSDLIELNI